MKNSRINSVLFYIICAILLLIIFFSISFFVIRIKHDSQNGQQSAEVQIQASKTSLFKDFGRLRTFTNDQNNIPVIITPVLAYKKTNEPLYEEICQKKPHLQAIILQYFSERTKKQLIQTGEETIKAQILRELNKQLSMGQLDEVYFEEYLFLD